MPPEDYWKYKESIQYVIEGGDKTLECNDTKSIYQRDGIRRIRPKTTSLFMITTIQEQYTIRK
jgi:hypothetical protein